MFGGTENIVHFKADAHTGPTQRATLFARVCVPSPTISLCASSIWNFSNGSNNEVTVWR